MAACLDSNNNKTYDIIFKGELQEVKGSAR